MALDNNLKIVTADSVNTGVGTSETSTVFDFGTSLSGSGDSTPFPDGATFVVVPSDLPEAGALPVRLDLELSVDGSNFRKVASVTFTNAALSVKAARFGPIDYAPEATVVSGTDRAAAVNLQARVVITYTTSAGTFVYDAFIAGPQWAGPFSE